MNILLEGKNLYIVNSIPQSLSRVEIVDHELRLYGEGLLDEGTIELRKDMETCLFCKQLKTVVFILRKGRIFKTSLLIENEAQFDTIVSAISEIAEVSEQNVKINGYANSLIEKLREGIEISVMDTQEESATYCSVCGMQCDPNIPYCLECGTPI